MTTPVVPGTGSTSRKRHVSDFLVWAAGGRFDVLADAESGRGRLTSMGGVILTTACLAAVSAGFALHMALGLPLWATIGCGVGWGIVILNLDRMLVIGMGHERSWKRNLGMALPRVALAIVLGAVISTPLTLQIFHSEISAEMQLQQQDRQHAFDQKLRDLDAQIATAQSRLSTNQAIIDGGATVDPANDPRVRAAQSDVTAKLAAYNSAHASYDTLAAKAQCEFNGTCGTKVPGDGPQYRAALKQATDQQKVSDAAYAALRASQRDLTSAQAIARKSAAGDTKTKERQATQAAGTASDDVKSLTAERKEQEKVFHSLNSHDTGILARLDALGALSDSSGTLRLAHDTLFLLFLFVELLPVFIKFLLNLSKESSYERILRQADDQEVETYAAALRSRTIEQRTKAKEARKVLRKSEKHRAQKQLRVLREINDHVADQQLEVVRDALRIWSEHAKSESRRVLDEYAARVEHVETPPRQVVTIPPITPSMIPSPPIDPGTITFVPTANGSTSSPTRRPTPTSSNGHETAVTDTLFTTTMELPPEESV